MIARLQSRGCIAPVTVPIINCFTAGDLIGADSSTLGRPIQPTHAPPAPVGIAPSRSAARAGATSAIACRAGRFVHRVARALWLAQSAAVTRRFAQATVFGAGLGQTARIGTRFCQTAPLVLNRTV